LCISDSVFDKMRQAWAASIPKAYAFTDKPTNNGYSGAIIAPPPPVAIFEKWIAMVSRPHVTAKQQEQAKRQEYRRTCGKRARPEPPLSSPAPSSMLVDLAESAL
jgi:hypothetical protein